MSDTPRILAIVGSLRKESFNAQMARLAQKALDERAQFSVLDYADVPFLNQDEEFPAPEGVRRAREAVAAADLVWFFMPEYNLALPAAPKNLIDWLSRPLVLGDYQTPRPLTGKLYAISAAAGSSSGAHARAALVKLLDFLEAQLVEGADEGYQLTPEAFQTGVWTPSQEDLERLSAQVDRVLAALQG